jgi:hypothetical protein
MKSTLRCISKVKFVFDLHLDPNVLFLEYGVWLCVTMLLHTWYTGFAAALTHNHATYSMKSTLRCISEIKFLFNLHLHFNVLFLEYGARLCVTSASASFYRMWLQHVI